MSGTIVANVGFESVTDEQVQVAEPRRKERCVASGERAESPNSFAKAEKYRPIDMLYTDGGGQTRTYFLFEYGKN